MRTRSPALRTLPSRTVSTRNLLPISVTSISLPRKAKADVREITRTPGTRVNALMISSVIPWQKYSWSLPGLMIDERQNGDRGRTGRFGEGHRGVRRRSRRDIHGPQIPKELARRAIAPIGIFLERLVDDGVERSRQRGVQGEKRRLQPIQELIEDCRGRIALKRRSPGRHLEQHDAECKQVRARIERPPERLFRRHVACRSNGTSAAALTSRRRRALRVRRSKSARGSSPHRSRES